VPGSTPAQAGARRLAACLLAALLNQAALAEVATFVGTSRLLAARETNGANVERGSARRQVFVSPDGARYAVLVIRTDVARNGNWLEVNTAGLASLSEAARIRTVARLFTSSLGDSGGYGKSALTLPAFAVIGWLNDHTIAFLWEGEPPEHHIQVVSVDLISGLIRQVTWLSTDVTRFDVAPNGSMIVTAVADRAARPAREELLAQGFSVESPDAFSVLSGEFRGRVRAHKEITRRFVGRGSTIKLSAGGVSISALDGWLPIEFSPDSGLAIVDWSVTSPPKHWLAYTHPIVQKELRARTKDRSTEDLLRVWQPHLVDLASGQSQVLWDAPVSPGMLVSWSPDGRSLLVGPTFLPTSAGSEAGLAGTAVAVIDVETRQFQELAVPRDFSVRGIGWRSARSVQLVGASGEQLTFSNEHGAWRVNDVKRAPPPASSPRIRLEVSEDLNTPPTLVAVDVVSGETRTVLNLNPGLADLPLGKVRRVQWRDRAGTEWSGTLYHPVEYVRSARYPLVIQTSARPQNGFSLFGGGELGLGANYGVYAAQALANRGIAVLQLNEVRAPDVIMTPKEPELYQRAYESATEHFVKEGLVDPTRVGLVGFSRSGWYVEYTLTHSTYPFAAAVVADNSDAGYLVAALAGWPEEYDRINGDAPFGRGLRAWLERAPAFNAERIRGALQLQVHSAGVPGILKAWEMFGRLRRLKKPAELYVIPDVERGSHGIQNPAQCVAAQTRAVDWFDFWLNGREDDDASKQQQYAKWREMAAGHTLLQEADS
jgi:dipeptidyl aminopeptidase/acylaminoacyl peptidase